MFSRQPRLRSALIRHQGYDLLISVYSCTSVVERPLEGRANASISPQIAQIAQIRFRRILPTARFAQGREGREDWIQMRLEGLCALRALGLLWSCRLRLGSGSKTPLVSRMESVATADSHHGGHGGTQETVFQRLPSLRDPSSVPPCSPAKWVVAFLLIRLSAAFFQPPACFAGSRTPRTRRLDPDAIGRPLRALCPLYFRCIGFSFEPRRHAWARPI